MHIIYCFQLLFSKLQESGVLDAVNRNKQIMKPFGSLVNQALLNLSKNVSTFNDAFLQPENDEIEEEAQNTANDLLDDGSDICHSRDNFDTPISQSILIPDDELNTKIWSFNQKQSEVFDMIHVWAKHSVKNLSSISTCVIEPLHL